ncbi:hypothetical protein [Salinimicrobium gaetbulicola]|uniref:Uncharacterized protein n=1 Tax=Salinimicrobium gaetbulicola TaxID=999702 RepID=A0ABW3IDC5_9FLAO
MKKFILFLSLMAGIPLMAQIETEVPDLFVRLFDLQGNKLGKGKVLLISDTSLTLNRKGRSMEFPIKEIGLVKTKRSGKHNVLIATAIGAVIGGMAGAASAEPDTWFGYTSSEGAFGGAVLGGAAGAGIGGITLLLKNSKTYIINGEPSNWKAFKDSIYLP